MASIEQQTAALAQQLGTVQNALEESCRREEDLNTRLQQVSGGVALGAGLQETMNRMVATQQAVLDATKKGDQKKVTLVDRRGLAKPNTHLMVLRSSCSGKLDWKLSSSRSTKILTLPRCGQKKKLTLSARHPS